MRHRNSLFLSAALRALFIFSLFLSFFSGHPSVALAATAEVTSFSGTVEVLMDGEEAYAPAEEGMELEAGDRIRTSGDGSVELSFNEENTNVVRLSGDAEAGLVLGEEEKIELAQGEAFASIASLPPDSSFEIRTPTAVTGARGTDWVTRVSGESTDVEAIDDNPYVKPIGQDGVVSRQMTQVRAGYATTVRRFQPPMAPRALAPADRARWQQVRTQVRDRAARAYERRPQRPRFDRDAFIRQQRQATGAGPRTSKPGMLDSGKKHVAADGIGGLGHQEGKSAVGLKEGATPASAAAQKDRPFVPAPVKGVKEPKEKAAEAENAAGGRPKAALKTAAPSVQRQAQGTAPFMGSRPANKAPAQGVRVFPLKNKPR